MSVNGKIHNAYNLHINKNTITVAPRKTFIKETNNFKPTEQRNNSSAEKTLQTAYSANTVISQKLLSLQNCSTAGVPLGSKCTSRTKNRLEN